MDATTLSGSCLCGTVRYEVRGTPTKFFHCHCSRCRKATGSGHASNLFVIAEGIDWTGGDDARAFYKLPDAERFSTHFCKTCGSLLPREIPALKSVMIPAGTLDSELEISPQARIFQDSRASWSCDDTNLTCFAEYPT